jgi:hypothetical protein
MFWKIKVPQKVKIYAWKMLLGVYQQGKQKIISIWKWTVCAKGVDV